MTALKNNKAGTLQCKRERQKLTAGHWRPLRRKIVGKITEKESTIIPPLKDLEA
jgi:hypothetical protein